MPVEVAETVVETPVAAPTSRAERMAAIVQKMSAADAGTAEDTSATEESNASTESQESPEAKAKAEETPKPDIAKPPADDGKMAAKFAALSRKEAQLQHARDEHAKTTRVAQEELRAAKEALAKEKAEVEAARAEIQSAREADHKLLADTPEKLFDRLYELGVTSRQDLEAIATKRWGERREKAKAAEEAAKAPKPLTQAEVEALFEKREKESAQKAAIAKVEADFVAETESLNDDKTEKYPASSTIWSRRKRVQLGHMIADKLRAAGESASYPEIADAVETLAQSHTRWHNAKKRHSKVVKEEPAAAPVAKTPASSVRQAAPEPKAKTPASTGEKTYAERRAAQKARIAALSHD